MTKSGKNLKKLSRSDLLELLVEYSKEVERLKVELEKREEAYAQLEQAYANLEMDYAELGRSQGESSVADDDVVRLVMSGASQAAEQIMAKTQIEAEDVLANAQHEAKVIIQEANEEAAIIRKYALMMLSDAKGEAGRIQDAAQRSSDELLAKTRRKCSDLIGQAQSEIDVLFEEADARALGGWK